MSGDPGPSPYPLPSHFSREQAVLIAAGIDSWGAIAGLSDRELDQLSRRGGALERQLRKLRGLSLIHISEPTRPY